MSNLVVIPGKMEDINKILNKDIKGIILGVKSLSIYPLELDIDSIIDIKNNTGMNIFYTVYGYLPIFYSRRCLITNYFKYIDKENNSDRYYIYNDDMKYMVIEHNFGTIIYSPLVNMINEIDKLSNIDNLIIDLSYNNDIDIIDKYLNKEHMDNTYTGFFDKKTIYKLRGGNNE